MTARPLPDSDEYARRRRDERRRQVRRRIAVALLVVGAAVAGYLLGAGPSIRLPAWVRALLGA